MWSFYKDWITHKIYVEIWITSIFYQTIKKLIYVKYLKNCKAPLKYIIKQFRKFQDSPFHKTKDQIDQRFLQ